ncbi:MAG TPA: CPBP family intramembrane glutamic endopeptidase [Candidatus Limnocylindria bacterium]|nr:CPBP family intramembrane glutamic endopeptidase [Candidatus Limnocylindria bacterium]
MLRRLLARAVAGPTYPPDAGDARDIAIAGIQLPLRATIAVFAATALLLLDHGQALLPRTPADGVGGLEPIVIQRFVLFLIVPLAIVIALFRDEPRRYGLALGDWRWGISLLLAGLAVMTPIILTLSGLESFRTYYGGEQTPLGQRVANHLAQLIPAEFLFRGFLLFALWRRIGALALVVVQVPFVLTHIGKPDVELWSTFVGGSIFAWLDWRTGSILWSALGHVYVLTLMLLAVGGASLGA